MIRIGLVSSVGSGGVSVTYPDTGKTTAELLVLSFAGLKQSFEKGDTVLVSHLTNDNSTGVVLGTIYAADVPKAELIVKDDMVTLKDSTGSISLAEIIAK